MNIDNKLEALKKIREVEAPDFLYTRIMASLDRGQVPVSNKWKLASAAGFALIVLMNVLVISTAAKRNTPGIEPVVNALNLTTQNHLYDE